MSEFSVRWNELEKSSDAIDKYSKQLLGYSNRIEKIKNSLQISSDASPRLKSGLGTICGELKSDAAKMSKMSSVLQQSGNIYKNTEKKLSGQGTSFNWNKKPKTTPKPNGSHDVNADDGNGDRTKNPDFLKLIFNLLKEFGVPGAFAGLIQDIYGMLTGADKVEGRLKTAKSALGLMGDAAGSFVNGKFSWKNFFGLSGDNSVDKFLDSFKVGNAKSVSGNLSTIAKWGGYALTTALYAYENFFGEDSNKMTLQRKIEKTVTESVLDIGIGVGVGFICASVGAPAIVGGLILAGVKWGADYLCNKFFNKSAFSAVSDLLLDAKDNLVNAVGEGAKAMGEKISGWWNQGLKQLSGAW